MGVVFVENLPSGSKYEIEAAFKPFGKVSWYPLETINGLSSGFFELATPQHAAHFSQLLQSLPLKTELVAKSSTKTTTEFASVTAMPIGILTRRIEAAIGQFGSNTQEPEPSKLDGTLKYEEIDPSERKIVEEYILQFRKHSKIEAIKRLRTTQYRVDRVLSLYHESDRSKNAGENEISAKYKELEDQYPEWNVKWEEFKDYLNTLSEKESELESRLEPVIKTATFFTKFKGVPPNIHKSQFIERRRLEIAEEAEAQLDIERESREREALNQESGELVISGHQITHTVEDLVLEYFGEQDRDLVEFIKPLIPQGREALLNGLRDLLLEETEQFVNKLINI